METVSLEIKSKEDLDIENPQQGIYEGVPDSQYFKVKALNNSRINTIADSSPAHAKFEADNPDYSSTSDQILGTVAHAKLLQPELLEERVKMLPEGSARTNKWKQALIDAFPDAPLSMDNKKAEN